MEAVGKKDILASLAEAVGVERPLAQEAVVVPSLVRQAEVKAVRLVAHGHRIHTLVVEPLALRPQGLAEAMDAEMAVGAVHTIPQAEQA